MRKRSVQRWSAQPGADRLETRALLSTVVFVAHRVDLPHPPGESGQMEDRASGRAGSPPPGMPEWTEMGGGSGRQSGGGPSGSPPPWMTGDRGDFHAPPPPRAGRLGALAFWSSTAGDGAASGFQPGVMVVKMASKGAPSKLGSQDPLPQAVQQVATDVLRAEEGGGRGPDGWHGFQMPGPGEAGRLESARQQILSFMQDAPGFLGGAPSRTDNPVWTVLSGVAEPDAATDIDARSVTVPLSLYRISAPTNYLLPPPVSIRDANGLVPVQRPSAPDTTGKVPLVVVRQGADSQPAPMPDAVGTPEPSEATSEVDPGTAAIGMSSEAEPQIPQLGIGLITDWIFKDPILSEGLSLATTEAEDMIRDHTFLSVAAVVGGLTAVEAGRRIVKRWMSEEAEAEADDSWIDGELLREWSGRMSPRFS